MITFGTLALVCVAAVAGPLLAAPRSWRIPVVVGELVIGVVLGPTFTGTLHSADPTLSFLAEVGFVLVMFVAGTHVPVRDPALRSAAGAGTRQAVLVAVLGGAAGFALAALFGTGHGALYAVLLACSSAAVVVPVVDEQGLTGPDVLSALAQVALADTACIVALPLAIDPKHAMRAAGGALAVTLAAAGLFLLLRETERRGWRHRLHEVSEERRFALELRLSLAMVFALAYLATSTHVSVMLAGFGFGLAVAGVGEPRRLAKQLFAVTEGFFAPVFFVWLGASLDLRDLVHHPRYVGLGLLLGVGALLVHLGARLTGQRASLAALSAAQLGVPVAATTVGTRLHVLRPGEAPALVLGALVTIAAATLSVRVLSRSAPPGEGEDSPLRAND